MLKKLLLFIAGILLGSTAAAAHFDKCIRLLNRVHQHELNEMHHDAFKGGWEACEGSPSMRLKHYNEFKKNSEV